MFAVLLDSTHKVIGEDLVVASNERKTLWACGIPNGLTINSNANLFIAVQHSVQVWEIISLGILQRDTWWNVRLSPAQW